MPYYARKVKRICDIRGCRNTNCYAVSKSREAGNSVIICRECLEGVLGVIKDKENDTPVPGKTIKSTPPDLFFLGAISKSKEKDVALTTGAETLETKSTGEDNTAKKSKASDKKTKSAK